MGNAKLGLLTPLPAASEVGVVIVTNKAGVVELGVKLTDVGSTPRRADTPSSSTRCRGSNYKPGREGGGESFFYVNLAYSVPNLCSSPSCRG